MNSQVELLRTCVAPTSFPGSLIRDPGNEVGVAHENLVYNLAYRESSIAQWLEHPTSILEGHWFNSHQLAKSEFFMNHHLPLAKSEKLICFLLSQCFCQDQ